MSSKDMKFLTIMAKFIYAVRDFAAFLGLFYLVVMKTNQSMMFAGNIANSKRIGLKQDLNL